MSRTSPALLLAAVLGGAVWLGTLWLQGATDATGATVEIAPPDTPASTSTPASGVASSTVDTPRVDAATPTPTGKPRTGKPTAEEPPTPTEEHEPSATRDLRVMVFGPDGEAVPSAPVHLVSELPFALGKFQDSHSGDTGVDGIAVLKGSARLLDMAFRESEPGHPYAPVRIGVRCSLSPKDRQGGLDEAWIVWLETEPAPGEILRVECPPLGWIQVEVTPDPLALEHSSAPFWVQWIRMEGDQRTGMRGGGPFKENARTHRIGPFACGSDFALTLSRLGRATPLEYRRVVIPPTHGEVLHVTFVEPASTWISGLARHPSGDPYASAPLRVYLGDPDSQPQGVVNVLTDDEGRWTIGVPRDAVADRLVLLGSGAKPPPRGEIAVALAGANPEAINVGEVVIHPRASSDRLLAAGRIRADDGTPPGRAEVAAYVVTGDDVDSQPIARVWTDSRGAYQLVCSDELPGNEIEIRTWSRGHLRPEARRVQIGSRAVDFTLFPGGAVTGEVLMDPAVNPEDIVLRFEGEGGARTVSVAEFQFQERGAFAGLVPGSYEIRFEIRKTDWLLLEVRGDLLDVETLDLGPFDLRGKVRALELHLTDASGAPVAKERFSLVDDDGVGHRALQSDAAGRIRCLVPSERSTFRFGNLTYGTHTIAGDSAPIELVLGG